MEHIKTYNQFNESTNEGIKDSFIDTIDNARSILPNTYRGKLERLMYDDDTEVEDMTSLLKQMFKKYINLHKNIDTLTYNEALLLLKAILDRISGVNTKLPELYLNDNKLVIR